jgi:hypothetical protein
VLGKHEWLGTSWGKDKTGRAQQAIEKLLSTQEAVQAALKADVSHLGRRMSLATFLINSAPMIRADISMK